ncbi:PadR family transcriptional regulator [Alkalimarinus sediminis]|uniref:PadR family transcriptional regulator n=1 Tax=Alkalimarinus sediminis TaxID=1632866 RepID=A0A9E8HH72_9ALTE|nr:PadR family transcriptional regulator [Alkalimarinus sediminis]UZW74610.1 PadR family transcriptional regulator [Alkalimarinus sediminis]
MSLKHAILVLLETEPSSGYDLVKHFKRSLGYFWNAKHQQVYQQLKKLTEDQWVTFQAHSQTDKPDKKVYEITALGKKELANWISQPVKANSINDALLVKLYGGHLAGKENLENELNTHIDIHQGTLKNLESIEQLYLSLDDDKKAHYLLPYMTLRRGIIGEKAWLEWAEEVKNTLKQADIKKAD